MNIPPLYPDELATGWRGRIRYFNHHPQIKHTVAELKSIFDRHLPDNQRLTKTTPHLFVLAHFAKMNPREFANQHSFLPFIRPFDSDILVHVDEKKKIEKCLRYGTHTGKIGSWFCTSCVNEDMDIYGMPYWRRTHQLVGVDWCHKHRHKLFGVPSNDALDQFPPLRGAEQGFIIPEGSSSLDDAEPVVQRYVYIANHFLERPLRLNLHKTALLLKRQFSAITHFDYSNKSDCVSHLEKDIPQFWLQSISRLRTKSQGSDILNFYKIFDHVQTPLDTERYVVALALLFETADAALRNLEQSDAIDTASEENQYKNGQDVWWRQDVLHDYTKNQGCHRAFSSQRGLSFKLTSNALAAHGLPDFGNTADRKKKALCAFFEGQPLMNVCQMYDLNSNDIEALLRIASSRLGEALKNM